MNQEAPIPNPVISPEEKAVADLLSHRDLDVIDSCILSHCFTRQLKVAKIIAETVADLADRFPGLSYIFYTLRLQHLVREGHLEGFGDLSVMRFSEVRLSGKRI